MADPLPLRPWCTEYRAPPEVAPITGTLCDTVYACTRQEAEAICEARRPGIEVVLGELLAEYEECDECGELFGVDFEGDEPAFGHAPLCIRRFTIGQPDMPEVF